MSTRSRHHRSLSDADVEDIYGLWGFGYKMKEIAEAYEISVSTVSTVVNRRRYQDLQLQEDIDTFSRDITGTQSLGIL